MLEILMNSGKNTDIILDTLVNIGVNSSGVISDLSGREVPFTVNKLSVVNFPSTTEKVISASAASDNYVLLSNIDSLKAVGLGDFEIEWESNSTSWNTYRLIFGLITTSNRVGILLRHTVQSATYGLQLGWNFGQQNGWNNTASTVPPTSTSDSSLLNQWLKFKLRRSSGMIRLWCNDVPIQFTGGGLSAPTLAISNTVDLNTLTKVMLLGGYSSTEASNTLNTYFRYMKVSRLIPAQ